MPATTFPPSKESELVSWSTIFSTRINADSALYGLTDPQANAYETLHLAFVAAYNTVQDPFTNSKQAVIAKNEAKEALLYGTDGAWELVRIIQAFPGITDALRGELGLRIPDTEQTRIPAPTTPPNLSIISTFGRSIKVRLQDQENPSRRGKPDGVQGATILYHVGETAPSDPALWVFSMNTSSTLFNVEIPMTVEPGSKVWLTAFWFNARKESSQAASAESTSISDGYAQAA